MKKHIISLALLLFASVLQAKADNNHFITDAAYRAKVETAFDQRMKVVGKEFCYLKAHDVSEQEAEALKFLYAYMPLADVTDYPTTFYIENIRMSFKAQKEMAWGREVPELLFRHFVLPIRVNNEALDDSRQIFYRDLKERVKGMSMKEAILEVNHWCHERVTYQPSDARTSAPLATIRSAYGRCGEESTFTVAALRAIGIPARQVYTPRWAHTDDNHAWVEAWADGSWYFLGACEPEAVLNLAWFNAPASRALLMHTQVFGDYNGPEDVMSRSSNYTEINLIDNYGSSAHIDFSVVDDKGEAVDNARVDFKIYNYGEFCPVVTKYTASDGSTSLSAGKGDMMVWASKDGDYGFAKASFGKDKTIVIKLDKHVGEAANMVFYRDSFDIVPPPERYNLPEVTAQQRELNTKRLAYEDSVRHAYMATFYTPQIAKAILRSMWLPEDEELVNFLTASSGNHQTILQFLACHKDNLQRAKDILATLRPKDLRDIDFDILEDNFYAKSDQLCLRVENELILHPFKIYFELAFSKKQQDLFRNNPAELVSWIKANIRLQQDAKAWRVTQTPIGVYNSRITDQRSRKIFFVDVARSLGIEARVDAVTSKLQYRKNGEWIDVVFEDVVQKAAPKGTLKLVYKGNGAVDDPKYYSHFTLARINPDGSTMLLEYPEDGTTWTKVFKNGVELDEGDYVLVTGMRLANGGVLSEMQMFRVKHSETTVVDMYLRTSETEVTVKGSFDSESKFKLLNGDEVSLLSQTGRGYFVTGLIGVGQEPTNHALKDIAKVAEVFEKWNRPIILLFEDEAAANKFRLSDFEGLPSNNIIYGIDSNGSLRKQIAENMKLRNPSQLPLFIISDTFNRIVYISQGYTIGLGEQMERVIRKL